MQNGPATIRVKKKHQWLNSQAEASSRTVYVDDSQSIVGKYSAHMTGNKFNETLPLIADFEIKSGGQEPSVIREELTQSSIKGSASPTTFEDYKHNLQTGSMALVYEQQQQKLLAKSNQTTQLNINSINQSTQHERLSPIHAKNGGNLYARPIKSLHQQHQQEKVSQLAHTTTSSKGILPVLNRSPSPSHIEPLDPFKEQRIQQSLDFSSFQGLDLVAQRRGMLGEGLVEARREALRDKLMKDVAASVTLKDGWRKVLLPNLDMRTKHNSAQVSDGRVSPLDERALRNLSSLNTSRLGHQKTYEQSRVKTVVNETNVQGRQSVENLLQIYTPQVGSASQSNYDLSPYLHQNSTENKRSPFLSPFASLTPNKSTIVDDHHYKIMIETNSKESKAAHQINLSSQDFSVVRNSLQKHGITRNGTNNINLRNSEALSFMRSQPRPIKRRELNPDSPLGELGSNSVFTKTQVNRALTNERKVINRSISPNNYDNGLGYAPRTIRLFNSKKDKKATKTINTTQRIAGKLLSKDNIFCSVAVAGGSRNYAKPRYQTQDHSVLPSEPTTQHLKAISSMSFASQRSSQVSTGRWSETGGQPQPQNPKERSRLKQYQQQQQHMTLQVQNLKDWAPTEMLSRSQLYSQKQLIEPPDISSIIVTGGQALQVLMVTPPEYQTITGQEATKPITTQLHPPLQEIHKMPKAVDKTSQQKKQLNQQQQQQPQQLQQANLGPFIKVSNHGMMLDTKSMSSSVESHSSALKFMQHISEWPDTLSQSLLQEHLKHAMQPEYGDQISDLPKTSSGEQMSSQQKQSIENSGVDRILYLSTPVAGQDNSEHLMANQATQIITEENFEKISLQNDEEWSAEVSKIMQLQLLKRQMDQQASRQAVAAAANGQAGQVNAVSPKVASNNLNIVDQLTQQQNPSFIAVQGVKQQLADRAAMMLRQRDEMTIIPPPPTSDVSISTMHLQTVSNLNNLNRLTGFQFARGDDLPQASMTNSDLQTVYANKTQMVLMTKDLDKPITLTDFKKQVNLIPVLSPAFKQSLTNGNLRQGIIIKGDTNNGHESFNLKQRNSQIGGDPTRIANAHEAKIEQSKQSSLGPVSTALSELEVLPRGGTMHPSLVTALQNSKHLKIRAPVRRQHRNKQLSSVLIPQVIAECDYLLPKHDDTMRLFQVPVTTASKDYDENEKGTLAMTMKSSLFQLHSVGLSERDTEMKLSRMATNNSPLDQIDRTSGINNDLKNHTNLRFSSLDEVSVVSPTPRLMNPRHANIVIMPNQQLYSPDNAPVSAFSPQVADKMTKNVAISSMSPPALKQKYMVMEQDQIQDNLLNHANPSSVYLGTSMKIMPTMKEIPPINIEFSLDLRPKVQSPVAAPQIKSCKLSPTKSPSLKKISLLKNSSTQSIRQKDRPNKKVNFSKKVLLPLKELLKVPPRYDKTDPMMHIQQMVKTNRYDLPVVEGEANKYIEITRNSQLEVNLKPNDSLQDSRESIRNRTQFLINSGEVSNREMSTMNENYADKVKKGLRQSQLDLQTIKMESPELLVMNSYRRTQEKFTQKLQTKMMSVKPIRSRQNTGTKQSPQNSSSPDTEAFKFAKNQASTSTFKDPSEQKFSQPQLELTNQTTTSGMRVSLHNKESSSGRPPIQKLPRKSPHGLHANQIIAENGTQGSSSRKQLNKHSKQQLSGDLTHVSNGVINFQNEASSRKKTSTRRKQQNSQVAAPMLTNKSCQEVDDSLAIDYQMVVTGQTSSSPKSLHESSPVITAADGYMAAKMEKTWGPKVGKINSKMLIIASHEVQEQHGGATANLPILTPTGTAEPRQNSSQDKKCSTPSSSEQVKKLLQMTEQLNITPAPYGFSSRGSAEKNN